MTLVPVGPGRSTRSATGGLRAAPFSCGLIGERDRGSPSSQRFAPRLRRGLPCGGPSIPLPLAQVVEPNTPARAFAGALAGG